MYYHTQQLGDYFYNNVDMIDYAIMKVCQLLSSYELINLSKTKKEISCTKQEGDDEEGRISTHEILNRLTRLSDFF